MRPHNRPGQQGSQAQRLGNRTGPTVSTRHEHPPNGRRLASLACDQRSLAGTRTGARTPAKHAQHGARKGSRSRLFRFQEGTAMVADSCFGHRWALLHPKLYVSPPKNGCIAAQKWAIGGHHKASSCPIAAIMRMYHRRRKVPHNRVKKRRQKWWSNALAIPL